MDNIVFLDRQAVEKLHTDSLQKYGGASGLRDANGIESAIAAALNCYDYGNGGPFEIAATYAYHIAQAQAYLDGNKRTAMASALAFLQLNGIEDWPSEEELYDAMIAIAEHRLDKLGLADIFRRAANSAS